MVTRTSRSGRTALGEAILRAARPLLRIHLLHYTRDVAGAPFPTDLPERQIEGGHVSRLLFIGDVALAGYGVLMHRMAVSYQAATRVRSRLGRGIRWEVVARPDLTALSAASTDYPSTDVAIIMLGIPDVLLATTPTQWTERIGALIDRIRVGSRPDTPVILAAMPPMADFRPMPHLVARLLNLQTRQLNSASHRLAGAVPAVTFLPFPDLPRNRRYVEEDFSWPDLHATWSTVIARAVTAALSPGEAHAASHPAPSRGVSDRVETASFSILPSRNSKMKTVS